MKFTLSIFGLLITFLSYGQTNSDTIKIIAKLVSSGEGSKIHIAKYEVIKTLEGEVSNDTISVGYYFNNENDSVFDTVLLTLISYTENSFIKDYYICPDYDTNKGIENVNLSRIDFDYWEGCETGKGECNSLFFTRKSKGEKWFLIMPCGGTETSVTLSEKKGIPKESDIIQKVNISFLLCPPVFDLTNLKDGNYFLYMQACGLGGQVEILLKTEKSINE